MADGDICQHAVTGADGQTYVCGEVHDPRKCRGHKTIRDDDGKAFSGTPRPIIGVRPCKQSPLKGMDVCRSHGGRGGRGGAERTKATVAQRVEQAKAEKIMAKAIVTYGLPVDTDPVEALLDEVRWTAGHVAWLRERVQEIEQKNLVWGKTKAEDHQATEFPGTNTTEAAAVNVWLELYTRERKHLVDVCKTAIQVGVEERRVKLAESQGALLASVITAILDDLGLTAEQQAKVSTVVPRHLRGVGSAA